MRALLALAFTATPALAEDYRPVKDKAQFIALLADKELRNGLYNLTLKVTPDGAIKGKALGWPVTGNWSWKDGYFCRTMDWDGYAIPYNCQLVEARDKTEMRFTVDRGAGDSAAFRLK